MKKVNLIVVLVIIILFGCSCFAKEYIIQELINGMTTKQQVIIDFGKPDEVTEDKDNNTVWIFKNAEIEDKDSGEKYSKHLLVLTFDKNSVLTNSEIKPVESGR